MLRDAGSCSGVFRTGGIPSSIRSGCLLSVRLTMPDAFQAIDTVTDPCPRDIFVPRQMSSPQLSACCQPSRPDCRLVARRNKSNFPDERSGTLVLTCLIARDFLIVQVPYHNFKQKPSPVANRNRCLPQCTKKQRASGIALERRVNLRHRVYR